MAMEYIYLNITKEEETEEIILSEEDYNSIVLSESDRGNAVDHFNTTESMLNLEIPYFYRDNHILALFIFRLMFESNNEEFDITLYYQYSGMRMGSRIFAYLEFLFKTEKQDWYILQKNQDVIHFSNGNMKRQLEWRFKNWGTVRGLGGDAILFYGIANAEEESKIYRQNIVTMAFSYVKLYFGIRDNDMNLKFKFLNNEKIRENFKKYERLLTYDEILGE
jgi:hypothetical protein